MNITIFFSIILVRELVKPILKYKGGGLDCNFWLSHPLYWSTVVYSLEDWNTGIDEETELITKLRVLVKNILP